MEPISIEELNQFDSKEYNSLIRNKYRQQKIDETVATINECLKRNWHETIEDIHPCVSLNYVLSGVGDDVMIEIVELYKAVGVTIFSFDLPDRGRLSWFAGTNAGKEIRIKQLEELLNPKPVYKIVLKSWIERIFS